MQGTVNHFAMRYWPEIDHPSPEVVISTRLTRCAGKYGRDNNKLILAAKYFHRYGPIGIVEIALHELAHWAVYWKHGFGPPDHGDEWAFEVAKTGLDPVESRYCEVDW